MGFIQFFFLLPTKAKFLHGFAQNEQLKSKAESVWQQLDGWSPWLLILTVVLGIGIAAYYYSAFNQMPGRHYKIKYWGFSFAIAIAISLIATAAIEYIFIQTNMKWRELHQLYWLFALNNAFYCAILYFLTSVVWCNYFSTNAYKFLRFRS